MAWFIVFLPCLTTSFTYLGCYADKYESAERDLDGSIFLEDLMDPARCEELCGEVSFRYFGLQWGTECWCGKSYGKHGKLPDKECSMPCTKTPSIKCGASLKSSVYEVAENKIVAPSARAKQISGVRPLLSLVMMVKNEAHTLRSSLLALKGVIDTYHILDTGSTDGTQNLIRDTLAPLPGTVYEEPFIDYGTSRNRILELAEKAANPPIFSLMLSADETVHNPSALREFCEKHRDSVGEMHEAYPIQVDVGWRFDSLRLSRTDKSWRYVGKVHEYLASPNRKWHPTLRVPGVWIKFHATDTQRRSAREGTILKILLKEKEENPKDERTSFYLARTYNVMGNHSQALAEFRHRVSLGGWKEEVYEALYAIAWQLKQLSKPWSEIQQAYLEAHAHSPHRAEPLVDIGVHYELEKQWGLVYLFASKAASLPYPSKAVLWVQAEVYAWKAHRLVALALLEMSGHVDGYGRDELLLGATHALRALKGQKTSAELKGIVEKYRARLKPGDIEKLAVEVEAIKETHPLDNGPTEEKQEFSFDIDWGQLLVVFFLTTLLLGAVSFTCLSFRPRTSFCRSLRRTDRIE